MSEPYWVPLGAAGGVLDPAGIGTSLPGSPVDGQEFVLVDSLTAPTYQWRFRYLAAKASNRWLFVGGAPKVVEVATQENITSTSFADLATDGPSFVIPVAGDYDVRGEANVTIVSGSATVTAALFANAVEMRGMPWYLAAGGGGVYGLGRVGGGITLAALTGHIVKLRYRTTGGTAQFSLRRLEVRPVTVGG